MNTKSAWMLGSFFVCLAPLCADPKSDVKPSPPAVVNPQISDGEIDYSNFDAGFVQPLPKDSSPFTVKPPPVGTIHNPALDSPIQDNTKLNRLLYDRTTRIVPVLPDTNTNTSPKQRSFRSWDSVLKSADEWRVSKAALSSVLSQLKRSYSVKLLMSSSPEQLFDDPKISMTLKGKTVEEKLDNLKVIGLSWHKNGDIYYVAWNEKDLPPAP